MTHKRVNKDGSVTDMDAERRYRAESRAHEALRTARRVKKVQELTDAGEQLSLKALWDEVFDGGVCGGKAHLLRCLALAGVTPEKEMTYHEAKKAWCAVRERLSWQRHYGNSDALTICKIAGGKKP